jgi:hypothetical protein
MHKYHGCHFKLMIWCALFEEEIKPAEEIIFPDIPQKRIATYLESLNTLTKK